MATQPPEGFSFTDEQTTNPTIAMPDGFSFTETKIDTLGDEASGIPGYIESLSTSLNQRWEETKQSRSDYHTGEINAAEARVQVLGKGVAGSAMDILGETVMLGLEGVSWLIPDSVEEPIIDTMKDSFDWVMNTEAGEEASKAFQSGYTAYSKWKKDKPQNAKTFESVVNVALLLAPVKAKGSSSPVPSASKQIDELENTFKKQKQKSTTALVEKMLAPEKTTVEMVGRTSQTGFLRKNKPILNQHEKDVIKEVVKTPGINPRSGFLSGRSFQYNYNVIKNENTKKADALMGELKDSKVIIHPETAKAAITKDLETLLTNNHYLASNASMKSNLELNVQTALKIIDKHPSTPSGLLAARKEFDKVLRDQRPKTFDPAAANVGVESAQVVRNAINNVVDQSVPGKNVKAKLREQHLLYTAMNSLEQKAAQEASLGMGRLWQNLSRTMQIKMDANRTWAVLAGTSAFSAAGGILSGLTGAVALGAFGYLAIKGTNSQATKAALVKILKMTDEAIQKSTNPDMIRQLRADRAIAQDLFEMPLEKEDE